MAINIFFPPNKKILALASLQKGEAGKSISTGHVYYLLPENSWLIIYPDSRTFRTARYHDVNLEATAEKVNVEININISH